MTTGYSSLFDKGRVCPSISAFPFWISLASVSKVGPNIKLQINMDQAGIANMEKDILPLQIEVIKAQINMTRIPISESVAG
eukprot:TCALIF_06213-PA protein Name:"Protein of unknown function" AED:0.28 eAED:0.28 QI:0/0/0.33/0.66/0/0.33/3/8/80